MNFKDLGLSTGLLATVAREGYAEPTPVQAAAIPLVLAGRDVLAAAQTGTGKTAAFVLPILDRLARHANASYSPARHPVRCLILTPTRELAMQIDASIKIYGASSGLRSTVVYGGVPIGPQIAEISAGREIVVATPGRLFDFVTQRAINLTQVEVLVMDEGDRLLDGNFVDDMRRVVSLIPKTHQTLLFSATFSEPVRKLAREFQKDPAIVEVARRNETASGIEQLLYPVDSHRKADLLVHLFRRDEAMDQVLVFTRTKLGASRLAAHLDRAGINAVAIHSDRTQGERTRALAAFKAGTVTALVATDVASRGLDIRALGHIVNYDMPRNPEDYIHRIGRTGRAGATGIAISLVSPEEVEELRGVQRLLRKAIPVATVAAFLPGR